ncbi:MAG: CheR family methyltransferase [Bacteroidales bacterium]
MAKPESLLTIAEIIRNTLGLNFSANRMADLEKGIQASAKELGIESDIDSICQWITTAKLTSKDIRIISSHLTIGETYFFREKTSLDLFVQIIIPELILKRRDNTRHIRIWCAGCSSGEEPYSLAILIKENFPELANWNLSILATDINPKFIHKAISGEYSEWSFRETDPEIKQKYFTKKDHHWVISPTIKKMVEFSFINLSGDDYPSYLSNTENIDVILCRNVFIYLSQEKIPEVAGKIHKSLAGDGWLITSQVELNDDFFAIFGKYVYEKNYFYRKIPKISSDSSKLRVRRGSESKAAGTTIKKSVPVIQRVVQPPADQIGMKLKEAKAFADKGDYTKAIECINLIVSSGEADPDIYYLYATILYEQGKSNEATDALRKVLYLNPRHMFSHMMLGYILRQNGKNESAGRHYKNALEILNNWNEEDIVPGSGGMTKGRIRVMIENLISGKSYEK